MKNRPLIAVTFLLACGHTQDQRPAAETAAQNTAEPAPIAAAEPPPLATDSIESFMLEHFIITAWARDSIVDGNLEVIRAPLLALAEYSYASVAPGGWMKGIAKLQAASRLTAQAQTIAAAASGIAAMGHLCGQCHSELGGPKVDYYGGEKKGPASDRFDGRMFRHAWAVERMWEGLTAPSDNAWYAGAEALAQAPSAVPKTDPALPPAVVQTLSLARELGVKAASADSAQAREKLYGELLVTCAQCHRHAPKIEF